MYNKNFRVNDDFSNLMTLWNKSLERRIYRRGKTALDIYKKIFKEKDERFIIELYELHLSLIN